ncbi:protocadherin Fat 4-like [Mytilus trossulus]|uniref:protocadherin Fat 4-like n=1 Tax=Mytilus trossulus TaxID=6551 RepID=UPI0030072CB9
MKNIDNSDSIIEIGFSDSSDNIIEIGLSDNSDSIIEINRSDNSDRIIEIGLSDNSDSIIEIGFSDNSDSAIEIGLSDNSDSIIEIGLSDNSDSIIESGLSDNSDSIIEIGLSDNSDSIIEIGLSDSSDSIIEIELGDIKTPMNTCQEQRARKRVAVLMEHEDYDFECCGFVNRWTFRSDLAGSVDAMVWRLDAGTSYTLVGFDTINSSIPSTVESEDIANGKRIRVNTGDLIGLHTTSSSFIIPCYLENQGNGNAGRKKRTFTSVLSSMSSPSPYDWNNADSDNAVCAIQATTTPSQDPSLTGLTDVIKHNDEVFAGDLLFTFTAADDDLEDANSLVITFSSATIYFGLQNTNEIRITTVPPIGSYNLTLTVTDPCGNLTTSTPTITVINRLPVINNLPSSVSIIEDTPDNTLIFTINATDTVTDPVTCVKHGGVGIPFSVTAMSSPSTGYGVYLDTGTTLNYDSNPSYTVNVRCNDTSDTVDDILTIVIIPNQAPVINSLPDTVSFLEDANTNTLLHPINVTDFEGDVISCYLIPTSTVFDISLVTPPNNEYGIYLIGGTTLDYDTTPSYSFTVKCEDQRRNDTASFIVNLIRNTPPVINSLPSTESISEDLITKTLIHTLNVTDVNTADIITCALNSHTTLFEIDGYRVFLIGGTTLNYDVTPTYLLDIECGDHRRNVSDVLTVNLIRNEPPSIVNLPMSCEIPESITAESLLYTVSVTDPTNDTVTCTLTTATNTFFLQSGSSQFETDIYVRGNQAFDYDTLNRYTLGIKCADQRRNDTSEFYIYLLRNMPPYFTNLQAKTPVSAQTAVTGQVVYSVTSVDPESDNVQYTMTSSSASAPFSINQNTGEISLSRSINTELSAGYELYINASDGRNNAASRTLSVRITDINKPPVFLNPSQTVTVLEGISIGSSILQPILTDDDVSDSHTFYASYLPPEGVIYFRVNATTGLITSTVAIDYETIPYKTFLLTITGSDFLMVDTTNITFNIQNTNEPPKFTKTKYAFTAIENSAGTVLQDPYYQFSDEDGDTVKFFFNCGTYTGLLDIDSSTGLLSYAIDYDLDVAGTASLVICEIYITDNEYTDTAYLNITVLDVNDNSPTFLSDEYTFVVVNSQSIGSTIGKVYANDNDVGTNGNVLYHLAQEDLNNGLFSVSSDGSIIIQQSLESFVPGTSLNLTVYAVDSGGQQDTALVNVILPVVDSNGNIYVDVIYYKSFFSYAPNMAWFVPLMVILFGTVIIVFHTVFKGYCRCKKIER